MVTIRCLVYNHEPYIRQCLEGFVMQNTNFRFEAIVHDDASTDGTAAIIKEYAEKYPDIIKPIFETENQYSKRDGSIRRIMDEHMHGKYIAFCEGDDYWTDPLKLQKQVNFLESHLEYIMSHTNNICYNQNTKCYYPEPCEATKNKLGNNITHEDIIEYARIILTLTVVIRKSVYEQAIKSDDFVFSSGKFLLGDIPLWYTAAKLGKIHYLEDKTSVYRVLENSASHIKGNKNKYKFAVSAQGLRAYLCRRDNLSKRLSFTIEKKYAHVLLHHLILNPNYTPIVPLLPNTYKIELFLLRHKILRPYLFFKQITRKILKKMSL